MAPCEIDADIDQGVGTPAWAHKGQDAINGIGFALHEGHRLTRDMVGTCVDAEDEIAVIWIVRHGGCLA